MIDDVCRKCGVLAVFSPSYLQEVTVVAVYRAYELSIGFLFLLVKYFQTAQRSFVAFYRCLTSVAIVSRVDDLAREGNYHFDNRFSK